MKNLLFLLIFSLSFFQAFTKDIIDFSIPDSLKENADVVVLSHEISYERTSKKNLTEKSKLIFTVLNNRAEGIEHMIIDYDNLSQINSIKCSVYDKNGKLEKTYKKNDIRDFSYYNNFTLYDDSRVKAVAPMSSSYPYTVVFEYEKTYDSFYLLTPWIPIQEYRTAIKHASISITTPITLPFIYKTNNNPLLISEEKNTDGDITHIWKINNAKAIEYEDFSPYLYQITPMVYFAPREFLFDGYEGSNRSWKAMGDFMYSLQYAKNELTDKTKEDLDNIKKQTDNPIVLTRLVYEYMQSKTRYVGIQLGIGGWQPFPSIVVDEKGYGDCKALSYYTKTLLDYVGITSIYTVITSGHRKIMFDDFPANQTNHIVLCVPMKEDSIWLECTSQIEAFNYLSSNCTNRKALLVKENNSELVYVPQKHKNIRTQKTQMSLQEDGRFLCKNTVTYSGKFYDKHTYLTTCSHKELNKYLQRTTPVSGIEIKSCSTQTNKEDITITVNNNFYASNLATQAGDRLFIDLNPFAQMSSYKKQRSERQNKVEIDNNSTYIDIITLDIPENYAIEYLPSGKADSSVYADYSFLIDSADNKIKIERELTIKSGSYPKEKYDEFIDFVNGVAEMDNCKVGLKKR